MRLVRYWVFLVIAFVLGIGTYAYYSVVHAVGSSVSASVGMLGPRYLIVSVGFFYLLIFLMCIVFLAFDVRARDGRERMLEALDCRPYSNIELVVGRFLAIFLLAWIPFVILLVIIQILGVLLPAMGSPFGRTVEPYSMMSLAFFVAPPAIGFTAALGIFIALLVRKQIPALLVSVAIIGGLYTLSLGMLPYTWSSSLDLMGFFQMPMPSDWLPGIALDAAAWMQRIGVLACSVALLFLAAVVHPRLDTTRHIPLLATAAAFFVCGLLLLTKTLMFRADNAEQIALWSNAHSIEQTPQNVDIESIRGTVILDPNSNMSLDLELEINLLENRDDTVVTFSFNPGFRIEQIAVQGDPVNEYSFTNGLLRVDVPNDPSSNSSASVKLTAAGRPDMRFAYLDSAIDFRALEFDKRDIELLGTENGLFDPRYVALMPGLHWLPRVHSGSGPNSASSTSADFYTMVLTVQVPPNWLVAGPGARQEEPSAGDATIFKFEPAAPVDQVALLAAPFESVSTSINGIAFELLLHPEHRDNLNTLTVGVPEVTTWVKEQLEIASNVGLTYPFKAFYLVEVPNSLRGYGGGWRMDTTLAPPGMGLLKETSLPTARFDYDVVETFGQGRRQRNEPNGDALIMRNRLHDFFRNDFTGGNLLNGIAKSFFAHQVAASGDGAVAIDYMMQQLATLTVSNARGYFSAGRITELGETLETIIGSEQNSEQELADRVIGAVTSDEVLWEQALSVPMDEIDPWREPKNTVDLLELKAGGGAQLIFDYLGAAKSGALLAGILDRHRGSTYSLEDLLDVSSTVDDALPELISAWTGDTGLPGFVVDNVDLYQLPDSQNGDTQIQLRMTITNREVVSGFARIALNFEADGRRSRTDILRIPGQSSIEFGTVLLEPPAEIYLEPYLSRNRGEFLVKRVVSGEIERRTLEPLEGMNPIDFINAQGGRIIVDDLDPGFKVTQSVEAGAQQDHEDGDGAVTVEMSTLREFSTQWRRLKEDTAWGLYRKTFTLVSSEGSERRSVFTTSVPSGGTWKLDIHMPVFWFDAQETFGQYALEIDTGESTQSVTFDARSVVNGWNRVGEYTLPEGTVSVRISTQTEGLGIVSDAISWTKAGQK